MGMCVDLQVIIIFIYSIHVYTFGFIKIVNIYSFVLMEIFWLMYLSNLRASHFSVSQTLGVDLIKGLFKQVQLYT